MRINIILPFLPKVPGGGMKIMLEYANRLSARGHDVIIYNVYNTKYLKHRLPQFVRTVIYNTIYAKYKPQWFRLDKNIETKNIPIIADKYIREANATISTNWISAFDLDKLDKTKGEKINLIQDYETWIGDTPNHIELLHETYKLPVKQVVVSDYLVDIFEKYSKRKPYVLYNAIDNKIFKITKPICERDNHTILMLFSEEERKGVKYSIEAIKRCKKAIPDLKVGMFGVPARPQYLEDWIEYYKQPEDLTSIYNNASIFLTSSIKEGWGLPACEAISCGCALVCSDVEGHKVFAKHDLTALLTKPKDVNDITEKLLRLLNDNTERIRIARNGNDEIKKFSWDNSINKLLEIIND